MKAYNSRNPNLLSPCIDSSKKKLHRPAIKFSQKNSPRKARQKQADRVKIVN